MNAILAVGAVDPSGLWSQIITFFSPDSTGEYPNLFPGLSDMVVTARKPFYLIAFTFLVWYLVNQFNRAQRFGGGAYPIVRAAVCIGCIAFTSQIINLTSDAFDDLGSSIGTSAAPGKIISDVDSILVAYADSTAAPSGGASSGGWLDTIMHPGKAIAAGMDSFMQGIQMLGVCIVVGIVTAFFKLAELIVVLSQCLRYLIVNLSSIFIPAMFAMLMVGALKSIGMRFVMTVVGVLAWPLAWGFGNLGTDALLTSIASKLDTPAPDLLSYIWVGVVLMVVPIWLIVVYIGGPVLISKFITTGANIAQAAVAGTAASALGVAGAAAIGATSGTASAMSNSVAGMRSFHLAGTGSGGTGSGGTGSGGTGSGGTGSSGTGSSGTGSSGTGSGGTGSGGTGSSGTGSSGTGSGGTESGGTGSSGTGSGGTGSGGTGSGGTGSGSKTARKSNGSTPITPGQIDESARVAGIGMASAFEAIQTPLADLAATEGLNQSQVMARSTLAAKKRASQPPAPRPAPVGSTKTN